MLVRKMMAAFGLSVAMAAFALVAPASGATTPADAGAKSISTTEACPRDNLCVYSGANFGGKQWNMHRCGMIHNIGFTSFGSDHVRSYRNNQSGSPVSIFYNWTGSAWQEIGRSRSPESVPNAAPHFSANPGGVDGVQVC
ncbi:peptidase inhibitor family I36 protein [Umezawaea sp. Da 62-37]|uniref:peptidase inhibitor family I36 protein n=1 Tax=Umezawaea sp. Da 62-37 TaxID=3075927 RepID=UPI0028F74E83|nr:peptidase inhibitor family I36 protein [Umezawaea sp. Da 62-37]WNV87405.1 peptidase inhibitor family I36 protein [Umezawaea sp. Da 62-37]